MGCSDKSIIDLLFIWNGFEKDDNDARSLRRLTANPIRSAEWPALVYETSSTSGYPSPVKCLRASSTTASVFYEYFDGQDKEWVDA